MRREADVRRTFGHRLVFGQAHFQWRAVEVQGHDLVGAQVFDVYDLGPQRVIKGFVPHVDELRTDTDLQGFATRTRRCVAVCASDSGRVSRGEPDAARLRLHLDQVHARAADEIADKGVARPLEQFPRRAELHDLPAVHHHECIGEGRGLQLIVGDVDHGDVELLVDLLELAPQFPLQVRVDHRQRLVEQDRRHVIRATNPRPMETFCFSSAVRLRAFLLSSAWRSSTSAISCTLL